ncbi:MAG: mandelate racemase/muconate lactonizing enzyme family protein [Alphaproteobacteria bacterium]|nr:mandelate racemase/muconate lactonizing enzyme family protein [Alphaproteobacteria bacterium]
MPRIEAVDFFYLAMPRIEDIGDGSQDACVVRVAVGGKTGWGECEAAPLPTIAALVCPMSHSACHPVIESVLCEKLEGPADLPRIGDRVRARSLDLLQAEHVLSGIDMALWDALGRLKDAPVWRLLGYRKSWPKLPYASVLFGDTAPETLAKARAIRAKGFRAAKFGWGPFGAGTLKADVDQLHAAREGLGRDGMLLVDAGTVWVENLPAAEKRLKALAAVKATWLEEPFVSGALAEYRALARKSKVRLAGGEGAHNFHMARHMIDHAGIGFVQIDAGRIGGITVAKRVADYARAKGVTYVNHTFTSPLALSASLQPFAGLRDHTICEYPLEAKDVALAITTNRIAPDADGEVMAPDAPGLGMTVDPARFKPYLQDVEIKVGGKALYRTPAI